MSRMLALACALVVFALAAGTVSTGALAQQAATPPYGPPITLDDANRVMAAAELEAAACRQSAAV